MDLLRDLMLGMRWLIIILHALTVVVLVIGLSGLSVGLGALLADFRETNPSKIASGFGGTPARRHDRRAGASRRHFVRNSVIGCTCCRSDAFAR